MESIGESGISCQRNPKEGRKKLPGKGKRRD